MRGDQRFVILDSTFSPRNSVPHNFHSWCKHQSVLIGLLLRMTRERELRQDDVMVRQYEGVFVLAYHTGDTLGGGQEGRVEEGINVTIMSSVSCEVMVSFAIDMDLLEGDIRDKVF